MVKMISAKDFAAAGYLRELNRQFLHPLGMALEVTIEDDGSSSFSGVWDSRDDPEGFVFADDIVNAAEAAEQSADITKQWLKKADVRLQRFGFIVQPLGSSHVDPIVDEETRKKVLEECREARAVMDKLTAPMEY